MRKAFIITNQYGHYLGKQREWLSGNDRRLLYRSEHRDDAVNTVFELSSKDFDLRASIAECDLDDQGQPRVTVVDMPEQPASDDEHSATISENMSEAADEADSTSEANTTEANRI